MNYVNVASISFRKKILIVDNIVLNSIAPKMRSHLHLFSFIVLMVTTSYRVSLAEPTLGSKLVDRMDVTFEMVALPEKDIKVLQADVAIYNVLGGEKQFLVHVQKDIDFDAEKKEAYLNLHIIYERDKSDKIIETSDTLTFFFKEKGDPDRDGEMDEVLLSASWSLEEFDHIRTNGVNLTTIFPANDLADPEFEDVMRESNDKAGGDKDEKPGDKDQDRKNDNDKNGDGKPDRPKIPFAALHYRVSLETSNEDKIYRNKPKTGGISIPSNVSNSLEEQNKKRTLDMVTMRPPTGATKKPGQPEAANAPAKESEK